MESLPRGKSFPETWLYFISHLSYFLALLPKGRCRVFVLGKKLSKHNSALHLFPENQGNPFKLTFPRETTFYVSKVHLCHCLCCGRFGPLTDKEGLSHGKEHTKKQLIFHINFYLKLQRALKISQVYHFNKENSNYVNAVRKNFLSLILVLRIKILSGYIFRK